MSANTTSQNSRSPSPFVDQALLELGRYLEKLAEHIKVNQLPPALAQYLEQAWQSSGQRKEPSGSSSEGGRGGSFVLTPGAGERPHGTGGPKPAPGGTRPVMQQADEVLQQVVQSAARLLEPLASLLPQAQSSALSQGVKAGADGLGAGLEGMANALTGALSETFTSGAHAGTKGAPADLRVLLRTMGTLGGMADKAQKELEHSLAAMVSVIAGGGSGDAARKNATGSMMTHTATYLRLSMVITLMPPS